MGIYETIAFITNIENNTSQRLSELEKKDNYNADLEKTMIKDLDVSYFAYNKGPERIIDYASVYSIFLTGAMLLIGLSTIYTQEYSSGVDNYILSSKKGRTSLLWAKVSASLIYTFVVVIAWEMFNLGWNIFQFGNEGWDTSIQHYFKYYFSPYSLNMWEYHFIQLGIHLLGAFSFAIMIVLISSLCKNSLIAFFINGAIFATPYLIVEMLMLPNGVEDIFKFSYIYIMNVEFLFEHFKTINLFGYPVLYPFVAIVWMVAFSMLLVSVTSQIVRKREVTL
jgi:ABC-type transport system involved in multi-copper enzyme maturation permease subunit